MKNIISKTLLSACLLSTTSLAQAEDHYFKLEANRSTASGSILGVTVPSGEAELGAGIVVGKNFSPNFSVEGALGDMSLSGETGLIYAGVNGVLSTPITKDLTAYGKGGLTFTSLSGPGATIEAVHPTFGLGVKYKIIDGINVFA